MNNINTAFQESTYTLIIASNYLPGFLLFELIELTTPMNFSLSFKLLFAFIAGLLITEWFYEWISICNNLFTFLRKDRRDYCDYLNIMSPVRILRQIAKVDDDNKLLSIQKSSYPQSMAFNCALGSIGWLLIFFTILSWKGLFYVLVGVPILVAGKSIICVLLKKEENEWIKRYTIFLIVLIAFLILVIFLEYGQNSEIVFIAGQNVDIEINRIYIFMIGLYCVFAGSSYYLNNITKALKHIELRKGG